MNHLKLFRAFRGRFDCMSASLSLAICWLLGLFLGAAYGLRAADGYIHLVRMAAWNRNSIVGIIIVSYIPLLLSGIAVHFKRPRFLLPICFFKAFLFTSCGSALFIAFGSAAWLVRLLLQFSDFGTMPFFYWFCMRSIQGRNDNSRADFWICSIAAAIIGLIDFCVISPFLVTLIDI